MKKILIATAYTAALLVAAACSNELPQEGGANRGGDLNEGTPLTLTASLPGGEGANTRISYDDQGTSGVKLTWTAGDAFRLYTGDPFSGAGTPEQAGLFTWQGNDGSGNANLFKGTLTATKPDGSLGYAAYYPADKFPQTPDAMSGIALTGQVQTKNGDMAHLAAYNIMSATLIDDLTKPIQFQSLLTLLTFDLTMPTDVNAQNAPTMLKIAAGNSFGPTNNFTGTIFNSGAPDRVSELSLGLKDITMGADNKLKAYMLVYPFELNRDNFSITVSTPTGDYTYEIENKTKNYEAGKRYTATVADASGWKKTDAMKFTVRTSMASQVFSIPFYDAGSTPANITVDWGDGNTTSVSKNATLKENDEFIHTYSKAGTYPITITSDAAAGQQQIPSLNFYKYRNNNGNGNNNKMLVSLDTSLLYMGSGETNFDKTFMLCTNLTTIHEGLFTKNPQVTNFSNCFYSCTNLTEVPEKLFEKNPEVINFTYCFFQCTKLKEIPPMLFVNNTKVTTFDACFNYCPTLTTVPEVLFANNMNVTSFKYCFNQCTQLKEIPPMLFANNPKVTDFTYCFRGCTVLTTVPKELFANNKMVEKFYACFLECTALTTIPDGFFAKNTKATNFSYCFKDCPNLVLTPGIFINETVDKSTRFKDQNIDFSSCFQNAGKNTSPGTAPDLWNYAISTSTGYNPKDCFNGCNMSNANDMTDEQKAAWGTPKFQ